MAELPNRIRELREDRGWSLRDLEQRCKINFNTLSRLETGASPLDYDKMKRISAAFQLPASALLNDEDVEFRLDETGTEFKRVLSDIPYGEQAATLQVARDLVRIVVATAAQRSAGALRGEARQVGALADIWNGFGEEQRDRALDILKVAGLR
jgi:transcriptional regulator with XRE-family HTH domain